MQETIKPEIAFDEWDSDNAHSIALNNNYWLEAVNDLLNESLEYGE